MGRFFAWLQKDSVAELKSDRDKLVNKRAELDEEIAAIDERIAALESENKDSN